MRINKNIIVFIFSCLILMIVTSTNTYAYTETTYKCFEGKKYIIDYNNEFVNSDNITFDDAKNGYVSCESSDKNNCKISVTETDLECTSTDTSTVITCPTSSLRDKFATNGKYDIYNYVSYSYNISTGKITVSIKDIFNNDVYIRLVTNKNSLNENFLRKTSFNDSEFLTSRGGYYSFQMNPSTTSGENIVYLEMYEKSNNDCNYSFASVFSYTAPDSSEIQVTNPAVTNVNSSQYQLCLKIMNDDTLIDSSSFSKASYVPLCYTSPISLDDYNTLSTQINDGYNTLKTYFSKVNDQVINNPTNLTGSTTNSNLCGSGSGQTKCNGTARLNTQTFVLYSGSYFDVVCNEYATSSGDTAKLTTAGGGFTYSTSYSVNRTCQIVSKGRSPASKKPQCSCWFEAINDHWDTDGKWQGTNSAGPNEEFDTCINTCDGGEYSQSCINSCYSSTYGTDTKRSSAVDIITFNLENSKILDFSTEIEKTSTEVWGGETDYQDGDGLKNNGSITTHYGNAGYQYGFYVNGTERCSFDMSNKCAGNGTRVIKHIEPSGCSWDPWPEYGNQLAQRYNDYIAALSRVASSIDGGEVVSFSIIDSSLKTGNTSYKFNVNSTEGNAIVKEVSSYVSGNKEIGSSKIGNDGSYGGIPDYVTLIKVDSVRNIKASLPKSYVNKVTGEAVYLQNNNNRNAFTIDNANNRLVNNAFNENNYYDGGNKYYTSIYSNNLNVQLNSQGKVALVSSNPCYNIDVSVSNLGTGGRFSTSNSCYYGVYNNIVITENELSDDVSGEVGGFKYIFRPVELTDLFPARNPRWNWTAAATLNVNGKDPYLGYNVAPSKTLLDIETKGNTILADSAGELDYEIIINRGSIKSIQSFNNQKNNPYTKFSLNCSTNGITLCTSNFLDNSTFIKNAGAVRKNAKVGTNND